MFHRFSFSSSSLKGRSVFVSLSKICIFITKYGTVFFVLSKWNEIETMICENLFGLQQVKNHLLSLNQIWMVIGDSIAHNICSLSGDKCCGFFLLAVLCFSLDLPFVRLFDFEQSQTNKQIRRSLFQRSTIMKIKNIPQMQTRVFCKAPEIKSPKSAIPMPNFTQLDQRICQFYYNITIHDQTYAFISNICK